MMPVHFMIAIGTPDIVQSPHHSNGSWNPAFNGIQIDAKNNLQNFANRHTMMWAEMYEE